MVGDGIRFVYMGFDSYKKGRLLVGLIFFVLITVLAKRFGV